MMDKLSLKKRIGRRSRLANEGKKRGKLRKSSQSAVETCAALTMAKQQTPRKKKKKKKKTQWKHSREVEEEKEKEHLYFKWILCSGIHLRLSVSGHADTNIVCMNAARRWDRDRGKQVRLWCVCLCLWMWKAAPSITAIRARGLLLILPSIWGQALEPVQKVKRDSRPCGFTVHNNTASLVCRISARRRRDKGSWWKVRLRSLLPDPDAIMVKWGDILRLLRCTSRRPSRLRRRLWWMTDSFISFAKSAFGKPPSDRSTAFNIFPPSFPISCSSSFLRFPTDLRYPLYFFSSSFFSRHSSPNRLSSTAKRFLIFVEQTYYLKRSTLFHKVKSDGEKNQ